jgi:hypothetical protein
VVTALIASSMPWGRRRDCIPELSIVAVRGGVHANFCRYLLRPPLALARLTESARGQVVFELPHPANLGYVYESLTLHQKLLADSQLTLS